MIQTNYNASSLPANRISQASEESKSDCEMVMRRIFRGAVYGAVTAAWVSASCIIWLPIICLTMIPEVSILGMLIITIPTIFAVSIVGGMVLGGINKFPLM